jgi:hypothetical protein
METTAPAEALLLVSVCTVPGTDPDDLGQRLADTVINVSPSAGAGRAT